MTAFAVDDADIKPVETKMPADFIGVIAQPAQFMPKEKHPHFSNCFHNNWMLPLRFTKYGSVCKPNLNYQLILRSWFTMQT